MFNIMYIMRGLPGSGKSSVAEALIGGIHDKYRKEFGFRFIEGKSGVICSTDYYFYDTWDEFGKYEFSPAKIGENHEHNQNAVEYAMSKSSRFIVVDNTNTQEWETLAYTDLAEKYGYKIVVVEVPNISLSYCEEKNTHGVPYKTLEAMDSRWESFRLKGSYGMAL